MFLVLQSLMGTLLDIGLPFLFVFSLIHWSRKRGRLSRLSEGWYSLVIQGVAALICLVFLGVRMTSRSSSTTSEVVAMSDARIEGRHIYVNGEDYYASIVYDASAKEPQLKRVTTTRTEVLSSIFNAKTTINEVEYELTLPLEKK